MDWEKDWGAPNGTLGGGPEVIVHRTVPTIVQFNCISRDEQR